MIRPARVDELATLADIDDDACTLYVEAGVRVDLLAAHPFAHAEKTRWAAALQRGDAFFAEEGGVPVGFIVLGRVDGEPYVDQLSVRRGAMRKGIGKALIAHALDWANARGPTLWLNTYGHVPWNEAYYARLGFVRVDEPLWGKEMRAILAEQRAALPDPAARVVMKMQVPQKPLRLASERLVLRSATNEDAQVLEAIAREPAVRAFWPEFDLDAPDETNFAITHADAIIGYIQYHENDDPEFRHAGLDLFLRTASHGHGFGKEAIRRMAAFLFDVRGHHRLVIDPAAHNTRAIATYEAVGFRRVGTMRQYQHLHGVWRDGVLLDMLRQPRDAVNTS